MDIHRTLTVLLIAVSCAQGTGLAAAEAARSGKASRHISDMILVGFRKNGTGEPGTIPSGVAGPNADAASRFTPMEVDPEVVNLPAFTVTGQNAAPLLNRNAVSPKTEAMPLVAGTGVTEFKGKRFTVLIQRILFIPVAFKISW